MVPQQTPRKLTNDPPPDVISPPQIAVVWVTLVSGVVITVGGTGVGDVVRVSSSPYEVPMLLVAYALTKYDVLANNPEMLLV